tara:strand:- start:854 stop:1399 length:546 start_codon:yes stop_codon:yes gene_type:complete
MVAAFGSLMMTASRAAFGAFYIMLLFVAVIFRLYKLLGLGILTFFASDEFYYFVYDTITFQNASSVGHVADEVFVGGENQILIYGVQIGVLGMFFYIAILGFGIYKSLLVFRKTEDSNTARIAFVAATTKFGLFLPLFTSNAELYTYVSLVTRWMMGYSLTAYNQLYSTMKSASDLPQNLA